MISEEGATTNPPAEGPSVHDRSQGAQVNPPAGFPRRVVAYLIDMTIFFLLFLFLSAAGWLASLLAASDLSSIDEANGPFLFFLTPALFVLFFGYYTFFHSYGGQTPGKILVRIKVVGEDGKPLPPARALIRTLGYFLSSIFFFAGFFLALFEKRGRALHDFLSRSEVVQA
jgi:uncharacterized RDD family membrane protein YckC